MEKFRILISQIIASIVIATLAILFCRHIMICTGLNSRISNLQIHNPVSITIIIGLLTVVVFAVKFIFWLMRDPKLELEEVDLGTIEKIPENK
jgi:hypothetical protein